MKFSFSNSALLKKSLLVSLSLSTLFGVIAINQHSQAQAKQPTASAIAQNSTANLTIAEIVAQSGGEYDNNDQDFDILLNALKQTGLINSLADQESDLTVLAPTDAAFLKLSQTQFDYSGNDEAAVIDTISEGFAEYKRIDVENGGSPNYEPFKLRDMLLYHILKEAKTSAELQGLTGSDRVVETLLFPGGVSAYDIAFVGDSIVHTGINLIEPKLQQGLTDIRASNGIIQGIDRVLFPYFLEPIISSRPALKAGEPNTIADVIYQSGGEFDNNDQDYDILLNLLQTAELTDLLADPNANLTLFAPNDAAFIKRYPKIKELTSHGSLKNTGEKQIDIAIMRSGDFEV